MNLRTLSECLTKEMDTVVINQRDYFMLVLRRTCGQSIVIGKNAEILVKVLRDENGTISIGIDAPKSVQVDRFEIYEKRRLQALSPSNEPILANTINFCSS